MNILIVSMISLILNIFLGKLRNNYKKMTLMWWILIHASIPVIIPLRIWLNTPKIWIPFYIAVAVLGQFIGARYLSTNTQEELKDKHQEKLYL